MTSSRNIALALGFMLAFGSAPVIADSNGKFPGVGSRRDYNNMCDIGNQANECHQKRDYEGAIKLYKRAISVYPYDSAAYQNLGNSLRKAGKLEDSVTAQKKAIELEPNYLSAWIGLGMSYEFMHKLIDAEKCYRKAVDIKPNSYGAVFDLGDVLRQQGKYTEAKVWLERAKRCPDKIDQEIANALRQCNKPGLSDKEASN